MTPPIGPADLESAADVDRLAHRVWGHSMRSTGVIHVAAVWRRSPETLLTLRIQENTPRSDYDAFALHLTRARADAIVTTGRILRSESALRHTLQGPGTLPSALAEWRRGALGKTAPPVSLVLTGSGDVDFDHPLFSGPGRALIYTGRAAAWELESRALDYGVEIVAVDRPSPEGAVDLLRRQFGAATVAIEAGPSAAAGLYGSPPEVDELLLTTYRAEGLPTGVRGPRFLEPRRISAALRRSSEPFHAAADEAGASWELVRRWRG
ncbi:MAG: hypothetical protein AAGN66_01665 [Acidobacteriota bacterium]